MKKVILLIVCIITLSGCSVEYNLTIDDSFTEDILVFTDDLSNLDVNQEDYYNKSYRALFSDMLNTNIMAYYNDENFDPYGEGIQTNVKYYNKKLINNNSMYGVNYNFDFDYNNFYRSNAIKACFNEINVSKYEDIYILKTNNKCKLFDTYPLLDNIKIIINTDFDIIYNNADFSSDGIYTWVIDRNNYSNKSINISFDTVTDNLDDFNPEDDNEIPDDENESPDDNSDTLDNQQSKNHILIILLVVSLFFVGLIIIIVVKRKKL